MRFLPSDFSNQYGAMSASGLASQYGISETLASSIAATAADLGIQPEWLANVIKFESRFDPKAVNSATGATGLIQFMPATLTEVGTTTSALKGMSAVQQMAFVGRYFNLPRIKSKGALKTQLDVFMAVIWPATIGKGPTYQIFAPGSTASKQNFGIVTAEDYYNLALYGTKPGESVPTAAIVQETLNTDIGGGVQAWHLLLVGGLGLGAVWMIFRRI